MREPLKDASGKITGYKMKCGSQTSRQDASGNLVGRFDENTNQTYDKRGKACFKGDHTELLDDESTD